uniref:Unannotated protein n=1 Tax=freshwater metagenome TaxID=449393 RepID=A0A6J7P5H0_9ZZZZ
MERSPLRLCEHEQRKVPEVDRVGPFADPLERRQLQKAPRTVIGVGAPKDHRNRGQHRKKCERARETVLRVVEANRAEHDHHEPDPCQYPPEERGAAHDRRSRNGEQRAGEQLPCAGRQPVEGERLTAGGDGDAGDERRRGDRHGEENDEAAEVAAQPRKPEERERPEEVELLLHRERPEVQQRFGQRELRIATACPKEQVGAEHRGSDRRSPGETPCERVKKGGRCHEGRHDHERRGREETAGTSGPECSEGDATGVVHLGDEEPGDEKARQHEEHVYAYVPPAHVSKTSVVQQHRDHGEGPETLDVRAELSPVGSRRGPGSHPDIEATQRRSVRSVLLRERPPRRPATAPR